eukprot:CAMPEP_0177734132 /NCGR_PEP_ID=MMETSP0484_2-20121128/24062_1 /TAXON_ID=354590 /ORGANISM="Rhodomonas lens, Strain RHODO" /LENGTH=203 /DNA_ID=CAMNT_0019247573 /DNA_START=259 /DNA_END=867 /DNA_ORIENTATION=+
MASMGGTGSNGDTPMGNNSLSLLQVSKKEVVMTLEQAKTAKVQKGYALEPVIPVAEALPEKRERKKVTQFGYDTYQDMVPSKAVDKSTPRPKPPKPAVHVSNGAARRDPVPAPAAPVYSPAPAPAPAPVYTPAAPVASIYTERKKVLQERLRRLNLQLQRVSRDHAADAQHAANAAAAQAAAQAAQARPPAVYHQEAPAAQAT